MIKDVSQIIKNEAKEQKGGFLRMLLSTLGVSLLGNLLTGKGAIATSKRRKAKISGRDTNRAGADTIRAGQEF